MAIKCWSYYAGMTGDDAVKTRCTKQNSSRGMVMSTNDKVKGKATVMSS